MRSNFLILFRGYGRVLRFFTVVAGLSAFVIMWLIDINALSRTILNAPLVGGVEFTQSLLPLVIMLPFGFALLRRDHVNTVLLTSRLSPRVARWLDTLWMFVGFVVFSLVTYGTFKYALRSYFLGEEVWGATIRFPIWPAKMAVSAGALLISLQCLLETIHGLAFEDDEAVRQNIEEHSEGPLDA